MGRGRGAPCGPAGGEPAGIACRITEAGLMNRRRKRRLPFAAYAALIFNAALCASPFIAARAISVAYGDKRPAFEATSEAIEATRQAMDVRFQRLSINAGAQPREV